MKPVQLEKSDPELASLFVDVVGGKIPAIVSNTRVFDRNKRIEIILKKPERNKPCPCGSGFKYKKCCGKS